MTTADILGSFLWHDLMTTDPGAASDFYPKVLGWKSEAMEGSDYKVWQTPKGMSGGTSQLDSDSKTPSHWLAYVGTPDIEATIDKAKELGGSVVKEIQEMPSVGKYAVIADPQGALIALFEPESADHADSGGSFTWHELTTSDLEAAWDFYSELFGWSKEGEHDMGPMGIYLLFGQDGKQLGGMYKQPPDRPGSPSWLSYMSVPSAADAAEATKDAGGQVANGPMEVPGGDLIAQLIDPQGAFFAVHQSNQKAAKAKKPRKSGAPKRETAEVEPVDATSAVSAAEESASDAPAPKKKKAASKSNGASAASAPADAEPAAKKAPASKSKAAAKTKAAAKSKAPAAKTSAAKKAPAKKAAGKKSVAKKAVSKVAARKSAPKKAAAKKAVAKKSKKTAAVKKSAAPAKKKASKKKASKKK
jgi:predicted enzyme related to lactoylglutathione lyase